MKILRVLTLSFASLIIYHLVSLSSTTQAQNLTTFLQCLESSSQLIYTPQNSSYASTLLSNIQNLRFVSPSMPKPAFIFTPSNESQIPAVILCSKSNGFQIRIRSGGHDYEGLSYTSQLPFVIVDLRNLSSVTIDVENQVAWIGGGVRLGQLYYRIAEESRNLGFPAGLETTVGVGGQFGGGGFGTMVRKYGLAADNILDARIISVSGDILDRKSMGEDLFWAIRGGGAASFGVVTAWKLRLVEVPKTVTVFTVRRTLQQNATDLVHRWQYIASKFDQDLFVRILLSRVNSSQEPTVEAAFNSMFLGNVSGLLPVMQKSFSELGLEKEDCIEMSWIESVMYFSTLPNGSSLADLLRTNPYPMTYYKAKSDYVTSPIPKKALEGLWQFFRDDEARAAQFIFVPNGGRMSEISESEIPFPHRGAYIYDIQHLVYWDEEGNKMADKYIKWIRKVYDYMKPYVSKNPRAAYLNYRDLDLGVNNEGNTSYAQASVWGVKYFNKNFDRLVQVKTIIDPDNFFRYEQSIPIVTS